VDRVPGLGEARGLPHHESLELEVDPREQTQRRVVLDYEDRVPWTLHRRRDGNGRIVPVASRTGTEERYATQMGELWSGLAHTLTRLDRLAADPELIADEDVPGLRRLQYRLHRVAEHVYGLAPPAGAAAAHAELAAALAGARDATAEVAEALEEDGTDGAAFLVHEWRGALFRVRLARLRLAGSRPRSTAAQPTSAPRSMRVPVSASIIVVLGAAAFVFGAAAGRWPVWLAGMVAVCAAALTYRP
jgi:hypothetical protein